MDSFRSCCEYRVRVQIDISPLAFKMHCHAFCSLCIWISYFLNYVKPVFVSFLKQRSRVFSPRWAFLRAIIPLPFASSMVFDYLKSCLPLRLAAKPSFTMLPTHAFPWLFPREGTVPLHWTLVIFLLSCIIHSLYMTLVYVYSCLLS